MPKRADRALIVVANRMPFTVTSEADGPRVAHSPGGLVAAVAPVLREQGGTWIGWNGVDRDRHPTLATFTAPASERMRFEAVPLSAREVNRYYDGFSNRTLWPLLHYFVGLTRIDLQTWKAYEAVNRRFAEVAVRAHEPGALVWVHDYQLMLVPAFIREARPDARIGFFLHVPFPASDVLRVLPWVRDLLRGLLAADLIGFHVRSYAQNFLRSAERLLGCEVDVTAGLVRFEGRDVAVRSLPVGIDAASVEGLARRDAAPAAIGPRVPRHILGVDRLDYTKGIAQRLLAIERLLERHPEHKRRIIFTQILVPSRERVQEYDTLKREIDETVGRINGRFSEPGWMPIRYRVRSLPIPELVALYRDSDVALVTPLRDGMNLVAKEYVAAQLELDGVLVLSELAGAAEELQEALTVNPFDVDALASALQTALTMPEDERRARMGALRDRVRAHDAHWWAREFVAATEAAAEHARDRGVTPAQEAQRMLGPWLARRPRAAILLDYDGTLTPLVSHPAEARLSSATREALAHVAASPRLDLVIVSGRALDDVRAMVGIEGLTYVGNHGLQIEGPGVTFRHPEADAWTQRLGKTRDALAALDIEGAWTEEKGSSLTYHVRAVAPDRKPEALKRARAVVRRHGLDARSAHEAVEARPPIAWDKGRAVLQVLRARHGPDWTTRVRALYVGDDQTDEDAFRALRGMGRSVCVTQSWRETEADLRLPDPESVTQLLRWLGAEAFRRQ